MFTATGLITIRIFESILNYLSLIGEMFLSTSVLVRHGKQSFRLYCNELYLCGPKNFLIVTMISFLFGTVIIAISAPQFEMFGAQIYAANLIGIAMARDFAPLLTGICLLFLAAARFTDDISAVKKIDKLIYAQCLIRILAVASAAPILALFGLCASILGGALIGEQQFDIHIYQYWNQILSAVPFSDIFLGLFKASLFGIEIAFLGCFYGIRCQSGKRTLGKSIILAISMGILLITLTDSFIEIILNIF